jgi:lipid II:glycine glycyltransferase (peptidoglycan interpeptide bridge formation enzyme)
MRNKNRYRTNATENIEYQENGYDICISHELTDYAWDSFLQKIPFANLVQTSLWGQIKSHSGWKPTRLIIKDNNEIIAGIQILTRSFPLFGLIGYAPRGPVYKRADDQLIRLLMDEIEKTTKKYRILILAIQMATENEKLEELISSRGYKSGSLEISPSATIRLDLTQDQNLLLSKMKRRNRRALRKSREAGMVVLEGNEEDLNDFYDLYINTSQRQKFIPFDKEYFIKLWQILKPHDMIQLFIAEYKGEKISTLLTMSFGNTIYTKSIGWSGQCSDLKPNHALYWAALLWAKTKNLQFCDLDGIDKDLARLIVVGKSLSTDQLANPTFFKTGFGGEICFYPETYSLIYNKYISIAFKIYLSKLFPSKILEKILNLIRVAN